MTDGFKCGIEIHQRLDTKKLFCGCYYNDEKGPGKGKHTPVTRRLRAVTGELGIVDPAAAFEEAKGKAISYDYNDADACLVELDEEPPHAINPDALAVALSLSNALSAKIADEIHVMRKTVVDGSAVSGFQRTALVALDGKLPTAKGSVGIQTICVEEESAGILDGKAGVTSYRLDRLGVPLIEIATDASIQDGKHAAEVALNIGELLRATGKVQRGIGSIRQDVNVSIAGGDRVEIKGVQDLAALAEIVDNETLRQSRLIELTKEIERRGLAPNGSIRSVAAAFKGTESPFIGKALASGSTIMATKLDGLAELLGREIMPNHRFGTELSDYAKATAGVRGIIHSDEDLSKYGITRKEDEAVRAELSCGRNDAWAAVVGDEATAVKALAAVVRRAALRGVPRETRRADGAISRFMRPLPGSARMYPETDVPPIAITTMHKSAAMAKVEKLDDKAKRFEELGLPPAMASEMARDRNCTAFEAHANKKNALVLATTLLQTLKALRREGEDANDVPQETIMAIVGKYEQGKLTKQAIPEVIRAASRGEDFAAKAESLRRVTGKQLAEIAAKAGSLDVLMRTHRLVVDGEEARRLFATKA